MSNQLYSKDILYDNTKKVMHNINVDKYFYKIDKTNYKYYYNILRTVTDQIDDHNQVQKLIDNNIDLSILNSVPIEILLENFIIYKNVKLSILKQALFSIENSSFIDIIGNIVNLPYIINEENIRIEKNKLRRFKLLSILLSKYLSYSTYLEMLEIYLDEIKNSDTFKILEKDIRHMYDRRKVCLTTFMNDSIVDFILNKF